jgi:hypothetical protein
LKKRRGEKGDLTEKPGMPDLVVKYKDIKKPQSCQAQELTPIILVTQETEIGKITVQGQPR